MKKPFLIPVCMLCALFVIWAAWQILSELGGKADWPTRQSELMASAVSDPDIQQKIWKWVAVNIYDKTGLLGDDNIVRSRAVEVGDDFDWTEYGVANEYHKFMKAIYYFNESGWLRVDFGVPRVGISVSSTTDFGDLEPFIIYRSQDRKIAVYKRSD